MSDKINHPAHYNTNNPQCECGKLIECIDVVRAQSFSIGNAIKYLWRYKHKNGVEDLQKAVWYIQDEISTISGDKSIE